MDGRTLSVDRWHIIDESCIVLRQIRVVLDRSIYAGQLFTVSLPERAKMKYPMGLTWSQNHTLFISRIGSSHYEQSTADTLSSSSHCTHTIFKPAAVFNLHYTRRRVDFSVSRVRVAQSVYLKHTLRRVFSTWHCSWFLSNIHTFAGECVV